MESKNVCTIEPIAHIRTDFKEKFGIPRQCGLVEELTGRIEFEPAFCNADALRGIQEFSHLWIIWGFSENNVNSENWAPLVRPPRLGGNIKVGVWATRSPFRPNNLAMSVVKLEAVDDSVPGKPAIIVSGVDMLDESPVYDIKPYVVYSDSIPDAISGFAVPANKFIEVTDPDNILSGLDEKTRRAVIGVLEQDPRAAYDKKPGHEYGMRFGEYDIRFTVDECIVITGI